MSAVAGGVFGDAVFRDCLVPGPRETGNANCSSTTTEMLPDSAILNKNKKRPNLVGPQEIVKVTVHASPEGIKDEDETNHQTFPVHKGHICHYSPFFDAAFNGTFVEAESQMVELYEIKPETFGIFVNWIYTQDIFSEGGEIPNIQGLVHLWLLADRLLVPSLQNQALDLIESTRKQKGNDRLPSEIFPVVYENTNAESVLRLYVIRVCSAPYLAKIKNTKNYPHEMLVDIVNAIRHRSTSKDRLASVDMEPFHLEEEKGDDHRAKRIRLR